MSLFCATNKPTGWNLVHERQHANLEVIVMSNEFTPFSTTDSVDVEYFSVERNFKLLRITRELHGAGLSSDADFVLHGMRSV